jgi:hypothetical protein
MSSAVARRASEPPTGTAFPGLRRESVADGTRRYIDGHPSIRDCLLYDIVNFTALARRIRRETSLGSQEAIEIACRRYRRQMQEERNHEEALRAVVRASHLELRSHVASVTLRGDLSFLSRLTLGVERTLPPRGQILSMFEGSGCATLLCDESLLSTLLGIIPRESIVAVRRRLSVVSVRSPEEVIVTPRILSFLADAFGRWGINCEEMTSVYTDTHFALKAADAVRAFEILSDLAQTTVDARSEPPESEGLLPAGDRIPAAPVGATHAPRRTVASDGRSRTRVGRR